MTEKNYLIGLYYEETSFKLVHKKYMYTTALNFELILKSKLNVEVNNSKSSPLSSFYLSCLHKPGEYPFFNCTSSYREIIEIFC